MRALIIQPPFVQLNTAYPAVHYLESFLGSLGHEAQAFDHSIALYRRIFSRKGLGLVFDRAEEAFSSAASLKPQEQREIERYLSYRSCYEAAIDSLMDFLSGGDPAFGHRLASAVEFPRGARAEALLEAAGGRIGPEEAQALATAILTDLGDLIRHLVDPSFDTVRYGERIAASARDFGEIRLALEDSFILTAFYRPLLKELWNSLDSVGRERVLILISVPFPGCLLGALAAAEEAKRHFGERALTIFGGGYISTELRGLRDPGIFDFADYLSFDAGYGSLASILEREASGEASSEAGLAPYRSMRRDREGRIRASGFRPEDLAADPRGSLSAGPEAGFPERVIEPCPGASRFEALEAEAVARSHPDYRSLKPRDYLRPLDSPNPMHRLWSESPWLKYRLAQGCYWARCAFCDTSLDYVAGYRPADLDPLLAAMDAAASRHGLHGIHFTDEAMPMARLLAFAEANRRRSLEGKRPFHFWGNMRFDASWTAERAELLSASGLVAVSGGIEIASERGLSLTDKGFTLPSLVRCLVGLRRAGLLVHGYLIYGFPGQTDEDIAESAELVRQFFASGLLDSAFWHRFVLTRQSRMMGELRSGRRSEPAFVDREGAFAANDLSFEGEDAYEAWGEPLDRALSAWMSGRNLERPFRERPRGKQIPPRPRPELVEGLIARAEAELDAPGTALERREAAPAARAYWTAGLPLAPAARRGRRQGSLVWAYRGARQEEDFGSQAEPLAAALAKLASLPEGMPLAALAESAALSRPEPSRLEPSRLEPLGRLVGRGLVILG